MLRELGQIASLLRQAPRIKEEMEKLQQRLGQVTAEGDAGGGMVRVRVNGRMEVISCRISEDVFLQGDRELLEQLVRSAVNQAMEKARALVAEESSKIAEGFGLPGMPDLERFLGGKGDGSS